MRLPIENLIAGFAGAVAIPTVPQNRTPSALAKVIEGVTAVKSSPSSPPAPRIVAAPTPKNRGARAPLTGETFHPDPLQPPTIIPASTESVLQKAVASPEPVLATPNLPATNAPESVSSKGYAESPAPGFLLTRVAFGLEPASAEATEDRSSASTHPHAPPADEPGVRPMAILNPRQSMTPGRPNLPPEPNLPNASVGAGLGRISGIRRATEEALGEAVSQVVAELLSRELSQILGPGGPFGP
jgi:hypothetical protein